MRIEKLREKLAALASSGEEAEDWPLQAAVALLLRETGEDWEVLLIKRVEDARDPWSGHIALPGGRRDPEDRTLWETAVRETHEEVGIDLEREGELLGQLTPLSPSNPQLPPIRVTPLVILVRPDVKVTIGPEVERAFWISLRVLKHQGRSARVEKFVEGKWRTWPAYPSPHGPIWGMTERILTQLLALWE
ncbi:MAG: CoA pyrophosphatase [Blastocatellia bacterium]|nr:CoA pyrophosphatase [Blastocatellia bacterium]MCS7158238.1 CoA pyrophosphatase [Blastocatellia bacterium]MCX7753076.1 CoA pyrophosphatase [Blastocatellia bacterium]MDW8169392.1 CoA pyrophosphatase [Acidobacteriota bacterium]MDW8256459.1 CoA pyrophosphatase [Acidobacteriota bacterium]